MNDETNPFDSPHTEVEELPKTKHGMSITEFFVVLLIMGGLIALLLPAVQQANDAARRLPEDHSLLKLKQIVLALHNYHEIYGALPPAYVADASGKPLYSWRVLILPQLGEQALYNRFDLDRAWNEGPNRKLVEQMPEIYANSRFDQETAQGRTNFVALVDKEEGRTVLRPGQSRSFDEIPDGTSATGLVVDHPGFFRVWSSPRDVAPAELLGALDWSANGGYGLCVAFADGSVRQILEKERGRLHGYVYCDDDIAGGY